MSVGEGLILLNARHWIIRARDQRYTTLIQEMTLGTPTPPVSTHPIRLQITALPTNAVGILRYWIRTFSAAISAARFGHGADELLSVWMPWGDMCRSYTPTFLVRVCNVVV